MQNNKLSPSILLALSEFATSAVLSYHLERCGFIVNTVKNTDEFMERARCVSPEIVVLDEKLSGALKPNNLINLLKNDSRTQNVKIILASASQEQNANFDSIIQKPLIPSELFNLIKSFVSQDAASNNKKIIRYKDIEMNLSTFRVNRSGKDIHLGPNEFKILQCFLELPDRALSRQHILNYVWGPNSKVETRTIDVHINRLRSALKISERELPIIKTIRSEGYSLSFVAESANSY